MKRPALTAFSVISIIVLILSFIFSIQYISSLDHEIQARFDGKRWSLPAAVYARPLELYPGLQLSPEMFEQELELGNYRKVKQPTGSGSYSRNGTYFSLITRGFHFPSGFEPSRHITVEFSLDAVTALTDVDTLAPLPLLRLDPAQIGSFHPLVHEDRILVTRDEIPEILIKTLLTVEDKNFYSHFGIAPMSVIRALAANLRAGRAVQGGSTLTQQLVKNLFLTNERTLTRKIREAVMAMLLEYHYSKDEILTAYINEVFLGQDNNRAIHGFALASQYYFSKDLRELAPEQIATLVGMVKGPSLYNPLKNAQICQDRRNAVISLMAEAGIIPPGQAGPLQDRPLLEGTVQKGGFNRFPAFLDVVRQQLAGEYHEEDLKTNGLQILTTLDPQVQLAAEHNLTSTIAALGKAKKLASLEGAAVVTGRETGEVLAIVGGRDATLHGFNRATSARRPIGSLVKPAVYLTALNANYTLASPLQDTAIEVPLAGQEPWKPQNYDKTEHGTVPLYVALENSFNLATVHLGMELGLDSVLTTLQELGIQQTPEPYPSLLLGAISLSPFDVCQMFQTIAAGGFYTPLRAISSVMAADHSLLTRYSISVEQRFSPATIFLLTHAMQRVTSEGTGKSLLDSPLGRLMIAGKTGTSDQLRDSWFAGFTGDHLALVWLGRDDNGPINLSGSSGALQVWKNIMENVPNNQLELIEPPGIAWQKIETVTFANSSLGSRATTVLPFLAGTEPFRQPPPLLDTAPLERKAQGLFDKIHRWLQ